MPLLRSGTLPEWQSFSCAYASLMCVNTCAQIVRYAFEFDIMLWPYVHLCFVPTHCTIGLSELTCVILVSVILI